MVLRLPLLLLFGLKSSAGNTLQDQEDIFGVLERLERALDEPWDPAADLERSPRAKKNNGQTTRTTSGLLTDNLYMRGLSDKRLYELLGERRARARAPRPTNSPVAVPTWEPPAPQFSFVDFTDNLEMRGRRLSDEGLYELLERVESRLKERRARARAPRPTNSPVESPKWEPFGTLASFGDFTDNLENRGRRLSDEGLYELLERVKERRARAGAPEPTKSPVAPPNQAVAPWMSPSSFADSTDHLEMRGRRRVDEDNFADMLDPEAMPTRPVVRPAIFSN